VVRTLFLIPNFPLEVTAVRTLFLIPHISR
jgi:hypothetical protein